MIYDIIQYAVDKERGIIRVMDICFEDTASISKIDEVLSEISKMDVLAPELMTREAFCLYCKVPDYVSYKMASMNVGSSFKYDGIKITRWSNRLYNGKKI